MFKQLMAPTTKRPGRVLKISSRRRLYRSLQSWHTYCSMIRETIMMRIVRSLIVCQGVF